MKSIYIETTIPSYATARPSADVIKTARQNLTLLFWKNERQNYNLYVSDYVFEECGEGDKKAAQRRLNLIADIPTLHPTAQTEALAAIYQEILRIPENAKTDAYHLAICVENGIDYLMSWNYTHMSIDAFVKLSAYNNARDVRTPFLITPEYFYKMEE